MRIFLILMLVLPLWAFAAGLEGRVSLVVDGKPLRAEEAAEAVVYFRPATVGPLTPPDTEYVMSTLRKQFEPHILPIVVGSMVRFPNQDTILHNAFSTSKDNAFDVGLYAEGEGKQVDLLEARLRACLLQCPPLDGRPHPRSRYPLFHAAGQGRALRPDRPARPNVATSWSGTIAPGPGTSRRCRARRPPRTSSSTSTCGAYRNT